MDWIKPVTVPVAPLIVIKARPSIASVTNGFMALTQSVTRTSPKARPQSVSDHLMTEHLERVRAHQGRNWGRI